MNRRKLDQIREYVDRSSPAPWDYDEDEHSWDLYSRREGMFHGMKILKAPKKDGPYANYWPNKNDGIFITNIREDAKLLLDEVDILRTMLRTVVICHQCDVEMDGLVTTLENYLDHEDAD